MYINVLLLIFVGFVYANKNSTTLNKTNNAFSESLQGSNNSTLKIFSEGEIVESQAPTLLLHKENHTLLEPLSNQPDKLKGNSVKGRKGALYFSRNDTTNDDIYFNKSKINTKVENSSITPLVHNISSSQNNTEPPSNKTFKDIKIPTIPTNIPKKPLILSYDALNIEDKNQKVTEPKLSAYNSPKPSPSLKIQQISSKTHPGMVMPIVITILVLPMFAVLGYLALKRGQEAWKNRHYKRMDYLLDGMYND